MMLHCLLAMHTGSEITSSRDARAVSGNVVSVTTCTCDLCSSSSITKPWLPSLLLLLPGGIGLRHGVDD